MTEIDPQRLSKAEAASPLGRALASAERDVPSDQELAKLAEGLGGVLSPAPGPVQLPAASSVLGKIGVGVGVAALVVGGLSLLRSPAATPATANPTSAVSVAKAPEVSARAATPEEPHSPTASTASAEPPVALPKLASDAPKAVASAGPSEPALLEQARRALASSPATALALTNQHAARFPHGVLTQESEVIAIEALRRLGRSSEANARAAAFGRAYPGSPHQRLVEDLGHK